MNRPGIELPPKLDVFRSINLLKVWNILKIRGDSRLRRYEQSKMHYVKEQQFYPETWYMGEEANAVLPRAEPEIAAQA